MQRIYLDHAATTPVAPEVFEAMKPYFTEVFGNPSSIYSYGQEAKAALEKARGQVAGLIGSTAEEIVFTGGGTEADNQAIHGALRLAGEGKNHIVTTVIEHHAVLETCRAFEEDGYRVTYLPVDESGTVDPDAVKKAIAPDTAVVSVMHANNEIGTIQPIEEISRITREAGVLFHTDAVQTAGHIPFTVDSLGADLLSMSAHKLYGPKGVGALYIRRGVKLPSFLHGGEQEKGRRAGTENVPGIVGFGRAAELAAEDIEAEAKRLTGLGNKLSEELLRSIDHSRLNGHHRHRLPGNVNISVEYVEGESMILNLDIAGICASTGSACSSVSLEASHVLRAIGLPPEMAHGSVRMTMGRSTNAGDVAKVVRTLPGIVGRLRAMSPLGNNKC